MSSKHIVNDPRNLVNDALAGLIQLSPALSLDAANRITHLTHVPKDTVAIISGGGSGHEPSHAGFVGQGLLSAAVSGNVFASPNVGQIRRALELVDNEKGILAIIMRYTGDVLLFGLAKEQHAVTHPGNPMELVIVGDDCAVPRKQGSLVGRRGLAGTVLVYKVASALAQTGASVAELKAMAELVAGPFGTIGIGLNHCNIPGTAGESHLEVDEVEIGMGIHNEPGIEKIKLPSSRTLITRMLGLITSTSDPERSFLPFKHDGKDQVVLIINNLGGISELEITSIVNDALEILREQKIVVRRVMAGSFMTSLNLPGFSITLLLLPRTGSASASVILDLLDSPASSPGWKKPSVPRAAEAVVVAPSSTAVVKSGGAPVPFSDFTLFASALKAACRNLIEAEPEITQYDTIAGDGDCGLTLKAGAESVLELLEKNGIDSKDCVTAVLNLAHVIEKSMDGTSGALYSIWTNALAAGLASGSVSGSSSTATSALWAVGLAHALTKLYNYTAARPPSRTLVDPLAAFTESFSGTSGGDFDAAFKAAFEAAQNTRNIEATAGRAAYVGQDELKAQRVPDPGAWGVIKILQGIQSVL